MSQPRRVLLLALSLPLSVSAATPPERTVPETAAAVVTDDYHGTAVADPYRWLEGSDAPELDGDDAALEERISEWTDRQNAYTRGILDGLPGRAVLEDRLRQLMEVGEVGLPKARGDLYFYKERRGDQAQPVLYVRRGHDGEPRSLLDVNTLDGDGLTALSWFTPSADGSLVAVGTYRAGDENSTLHLLRSADGEWLADEIPGKVQSVQWLPDGSGFVYRRLADLEDPYSGRIKLHRVGRHERHDELIFAQYTEGPLATTWGPSAYSNREGRWLVLVYWTGTESNDLWVYDLARWREHGELRRTDVMIGQKATAWGPIVGDTLYLTTTLGAPNGRVFAVDLERPERDRWREVIPEREAVLEGVAAAPGMLVASYLADAVSRIERFDLDGEPLGAVELPGLGSASIEVDEDRTEAFLSYESFNEPDSIYRVDLETGRRELWARPDVPVDPARLVVEQRRFRSKDGTEVPMFVVHPKEWKPGDGPRPTILSGYGGFNVSVKPRFRSTAFPWLEAGGIWVSVNLRGGGEYGEDWHRAGMLENKQNVFDDFIAAGEWLIESGYTTREQLGVYGGSNGGLLTGAAVVQRPELFSAAISAVPLLDMLRYQHFLMARYWVPEYGSAEDPDQFPFLAAYSPYHGVREGIDYPAVLLTAGENDARVHPLHARKMAARLQAATASDPATEPILLRVERDAGHGAGKPLDLRVRDSADVYIFLAWQTGLDFARSPVPTTIGGS